MSQKNTTPLVVCYGELLWDISKDLEKPGGTPLNIIYHLQKLKKRGLLISRIGNDDSGKKLVHALKIKKISMDLCQVDGHYITGVENVLRKGTMDLDYKIIYPAAWDFIEWNDEVAVKVSEADYFVFDSVAARNINSRKTLFGLLKLAKTKVFNVNLRSPHYHREVIKELLYHSNLVKMTVRELETISQWDSNYFDDLSAMNFIKKNYNIQTLIVTKDEEGVLLNIGNKFYHHEKYKTDSHDGIDSSDAFLAAFLSKMIDGSLPSEILDFSCATESVVASLNNNNPDYKLKEIFQLIGMAN